MSPLFVQGSHTFAMFYAHALREKPVTHAHITLTDFTRFAQNCVCLHCMVHVATLKVRPDKAINLALLHEDIWTNFSA